MKHESAARKQVSHEQPAPARNRRILVVDDEPAILQAYKDILQPQKGQAALRSSRTKAGGPASSIQTNDDFEVVAVPNGEEAVAEVKKALQSKNNFAMGFFDVLLGQGIDGIEAVRQIHALDPELYAVLVTAYQDRHVNSIQEIFGREFQDRWDYLNKPFSEGEILQKARNMVAMWNIRRHEEELVRKMFESEKLLAVAAVARGVGHEFGNILLQIMGRADLSRSADPAEMKKALETILTATEHATQVLNRFKSLSSSPEQSFDRVSLLQIISDTLSLVSHELRKRNIRTLVEVNSLPEITGVRTGLVQVFMNLIINAIHAVDHDGTITFSGNARADEVEIRVRDTGPGIPPDHVDKIFEAFFTTKGEKGTGLGLAICREIIEINHNGKIVAQNHADGGAEFVITLPVKGGQS